MALQRHLLRTLQSAPARLPGRVTSVSAQHLSRRTYATADKLNEVKKSSDLPWLIGSLGLGVPGAYWLLSNRPETSAGHYAQEEKAHESKEAEKAGGGQKGEAKAVKEENEQEAPSEPSKRDQPSTQKEPADEPGAMSSKQEGLANADTANPYVYEADQSGKGEGETETAKVKGTVSPERPQN